MRKIGCLILLVVFLSIFSFGCDNSYENNLNYNIKARGTFNGSHELRKLTEGSFQTETVSGSGFFFFGTGLVDLSGEKSTNNNIIFAWENKGEYIISSVPLERVRIRLDPDINIPSVQFVFNDDFTSNRSGYYDDVLIRCGQQYIVDRNLLYVILMVNPEQWPTNISMPLSN